VQEILDKIKQLSLDNNSTENLEKLVYELSSLGWSKQKIYNVFEKFHIDFQETEEWIKIEKENGDHPVDLILDRLSGWCRSDIILLPNETINFTIRNDFSDPFIYKLVEIFPFPKEGHMHIAYDVYYIQFPSPNNKLNILISSGKNGVTIGFAAGNDRFGWHIHGDMLQAKSQSEMVVKASELLKQITEDKLQIVYSSTLGYFIRTDEQVNIEKYREKDEIIEYTYWSKL
jgi:hypothetical protein